jgi:AraC-like DNA-binding protein
MYSQLHESALRGPTEWLCQAADAFQRVVLCVAQPPTDLPALKRELSRIPVPTTHFERFSLRYLTCECFAAIVAGEAGCRPQRPREFVSFLRALHSDSDPIERFSKLVTDLCRPTEVPHASLAEQIGSRIEREYPSRITAHRIAREYQVSRVRLDRTFLRQFGLRFHEYLTAVRVRHGLALVVGGLKIEAAAPAVGYKSKKDFYRAVKLQTGLTPGQVRRQCRTTRVSHDAAGTGPLPPLDQRSAGNVASLQTRPGR